MALRRGIALVITIIMAVLLNYLLLPAWTFSSAGFWGYWLLVFFCAMVLFFLFEASDEEYAGTIITSCLAASVVLILFFASLFSGEMFSARAFRNVITISEDGNFDWDIPRVRDSRDIPIVDMLTARQLGDRTMGTMEKYLSQYEVDNEYNLICYKGEYYRISPMLYGGFWKYLNSKENGIPGYVLVNIYTQEAKLVHLDQPIKYSPSASFGDKLMRHLRSKYPSYVFGKPQFEIDDEGVPFYIVPIEDATVGLFGARKIERAVLVNAINGKTEEVHINDMPQWVDHVFSVDYIMTRVEWYYGYVNGYFNASFSKKDVRKTSYSYDKSQYYFIPMDDGIYLYTGITSAGKDESNIGFILANVRTGKITYYSSPGAEESSAQASAEGVVQQYGYKAGPVMLVNIDGIETYFMTMKDKQLLVKGYAFVNKSNYTIAVVEDTLPKAIGSYRAKFSQIISMAEAADVSGIISDIYTAVRDGNTMFYFKLQGDDKLYVSSIVNNDHQVAMKVGDKVSLEFVLTNQNTAVVQSIKIE